MLEILLKVDSNLKKTLKEFLKIKQTKMLIKM